MTIKTILGCGRLSWSAAERRSDRYGSVTLMLDGNSLTPEPTTYIQLDRTAVGQTGTLIAEVTETRDSTHIGDLFRGIFPKTPAVGDRITLGTGRLFIERSSYGADEAGLEPNDGRQTDWLDPKALYRVHEQTVVLSFVRDGGAS